MAYFPNWLTYLIPGLLGALFGSFANVMIARIPQGASIAWPGSHCPCCQTPIRWYDNVPLLGYLFLGGYCRSCRIRISPRYPLVEFLAILLFLAVRHRMGWNWLLFVRDFPFALILLAITFIDIDHRIIPDRLSLGGLGLGLITAFFTPRMGIGLSVAGAAVGFFAFFSVAWLYQWRSGRMGLGGGDIKLLAMLGSFVGPLGVLETVLISSILGSVFGLGWAFLNRREANLMKIAIPYGPFLVIGGLYAYLMDEGTWLHFMTQI